MKKTIKVIALIMALALVLCGCGTKEESSTTGTAEFDYGKGIDENGYWKDIKVSDYVTVCNLTDIPVTQEDIEAEIEEMLNTEDYMEMAPITNVAAKDGDTVNIDYVGSIDGVEFDGGNTNGSGATVTIGVTNYIDDFLDQIIGHMPGDNFDIYVTFPEDYGNEELNGKDAVFNTTLNYVCEYKVQALTDSFVEEYFSESNGWETVEELRSGVRGYLVENYVFNNSTYADEMPEIMTEQYIARMKYETEQYAAYYGMEADDYVSAMYGGYGFSTLDDLVSYYSYYADEAAKTYVLYQAIAEANNMTVTDDDLEAYYEANDMTDDAESVVSYYGINFVKNMALYQKVADYLYAL